MFSKDDIHSAKGHKDASLESDHAMMCKYRDIDIGLLNTLTMADSRYIAATLSAYMIGSKSHTRLSNERKMMMMYENIYGGA